MSSIRYRIEHHEGAAVRTLGELADVPAHHATLEPFVGRLLLEGRRGEVWLVESATGVRVVRRRVRPFGDRASERFRHAVAGERDPA